MQKVYGSWTSVDFAKASNFAANQIRMLKCRDKSIRSKLCTSEGDECLGWTPKSGSTWDTPSKISNITCSTGSDCSKSMAGRDCLGKCSGNDAKCADDASCPSGQTCTSKKCSYLPDNTGRGECVILSEDLCASSSELPYTVNDKGAYVKKGVCNGSLCADASDCGTGTTGECVKKCEGDECTSDAHCENKKGFNGKCGANSKCEGDVCTDDTMCSTDICGVGGNGVCTPATCTTQGSEGSEECGTGTDGVCYGLGRCPPTVTSKDYLEWRSNKDPSHPGKCVIGNSLLRKYCAHPQCRTEDKAKDPDADDAPWTYDVSAGTCYISNEYCRTKTAPFENRGKEVDDDDTCTASTDCHADDKCMTQPKDGLGAISRECATGDKGCFCQGEESQCKVPNMGDTMMGWLVGETVYKMTQGDIKAGSCDWWPWDDTQSSAVTETFEKFGSTSNLFEIFARMSSSTLDESSNAVKVLDFRPGYTKEILLKDYVPGVDLLRFTNPNDETDTDIDIDAEQLQRTHPDLVTVNADGTSTVRIARADIRNNNAVKRLFSIIQLKPALNQFATAMDKY